MLGTRRAQAVDSLDAREAADILQHIRGRTVLDVGGCDGKHAAVWAAAGLDVTIMDNKSYSHGEAAGLAAAGIRLINQDFYAGQDKRRYDTVVSLRAMNPEGALGRELGMADMRVISMVFMPFSRDVWDAQKRNYIEWLDGVAKAVERSNGGIAAHIALLDDPEELVEPKDFRNRFSLQDLRHEWDSDRMCISGTDFHVMLIIVDRNRGGAEAQLPSDPRKRYGYYNGK